MVPSGVQFLSQVEATLFSPTLQRLQDLSLWSLTGGRLWRPKNVPDPPEASQHPLLWRLTDGRAPSGVPILSQAEAMLFSPTLQRLQDMSLWSLTGGRLWRPKNVPGPPEAPQHPLLWRLKDGMVPSGVPILSQAEVMLFSPTLQRLQDMSFLEPHGWKSLEAGKCSGPSRGFTASVTVEAH